MTAPVLGFSGVLQAVVSATAAQLAALDVTAIPLIPAPGANKAIVLLAVVYRLIAGTAPYTAGASGLYYSFANKNGADNGDNGMFEQAVSSVCLSSGIFDNEEYAPVTVVKNQGIAWGASTPFVGGNGTATVTAIYTIVDVA